MGFFVIVGFILFFYLLYRVNTLDEKVTALLKKGGGMPVQKQSQGETTLKVPVPSAAALREKVEERPIFANVSPKPEAVPASSDKNAEFAFGSKVLTGVGVFALLLGVGFFLRYAFERDLISESMRVILGVLLGVVTSGAGHFLRKKYPQYGLTLVGAGFGVMYLSIYAAYAFYDILSPSFALIALLLVTGGSVAMSLWYNSKPLVIYSLLGAFLIPFLLPLSLSVHALFAYLLIINAGVLLIARFKVWPEITVLSLIGASLIYIQWVTGPYKESELTITLFYASVLFLMYFLTSLLNFVFRDRDYKGIDGFLAYGIPIIYFLLNLLIVHGKNEIALLAFSIGLFYALIAVVIRAGFKNVGALLTFSNAMLFIALSFLALSTALHFEGSSVTIIWAIEAILMIGIGYLLKARSNRIGGLILAVLTGLKLLVTDLDLPSGSEMIWNERSLVILSVLLLYILIWKVYSSLEEKGASIPADEKFAGKNLGALGVFSLVSLWATLEASDFIPNYTLYLPLIWIGVALLMISLSFLSKEKSIRYLSYMGLGAVALFSLIFHWGLDLSEHMSLFNIRVGTALALALLVAYIIWLSKVYASDVSKEEREVLPILVGGANLIILWALTLEILGYFNMELRNVAMSVESASIENTKRVVLSLFWLVYALAGLAVGIFKRSRFARYFSIILFGITVFKIFLYDTANLSDVYRFVSFIALGVILLLAGFFYYRFKDRITQFVRAEERPSL